MKFLLLLSWIFVLCVANIESDLSFEEAAKNQLSEIEDFSPGTVNEVEHNISDVDSDSDKENNFQNARIAGGKIAKKNSVSYHAVLSVMSDEGITGCNGALIFSTRVVTLSKCIPSTTFTSITIHLGVRNFYNEGERGRVIRIILKDNEHTGKVTFGSTGTASAAFAVIDFPAVTLSRRIRPIRLPTPVTTPPSYVGYLMKICGFGRYRRHPVARRIRFAKGRVIPKNRCGKDSDNYICFSGWKGRAACHGDLGSPMTTKFRYYGPTLVALVSEVATDCSGNRPREHTVGVRVAAALDYITSPSPTDTATMPTTDESSTTDESLPTDKSLPTDEPTEGPVIPTRPTKPPS